MAFWAIALALTCLSLGLVFAPLLRGPGRAQAPDRAAFDVAVYRDQLAGVEADLERGVLTADEATASRAEIARRLLAADAAAGRASPAPGRAPPLIGAAMLAALVLAAGGLYARLGAPGLPDQPRATRLAQAAAAWAERPGQAESEAVASARRPPPGEAPRDEQALVARLEAVLADRPNDAAGWRLLAQSLGALDRWPEARAAQARVVEIGGAGAPPADLVALAQIMIVAAGGYVSPEAEAAVARALERAPEDPVARYYSGLAAMQAGRPDLALPIWSRLVAEGPPEAPWVAAIEAELGTGPPPGPAVASPPGPGAREIEAAGVMPAEDRQAMIEGMVDRLADRLAAEGGPPADWAQLIRSLGVLGRREAAVAIRDEARATFAEDAAALALIAAAAQDAGIGQ